jgi:hypothetical protein
MSDWQTVEQRHLAAAQAWCLARLQSDTTQSLASTLAAIESEAPPPRAITLRQRVGLSRFELDLLLLCACTTLDPRLATLCATRQGAPERSAPTFALAATLLDDPAWDALSPARPLRAHRLLETGPGPAPHAPLHLDARVLQALQGLDHLDERLVPHTTAIAEQDTTAELPPSQQSAVAGILTALRSPRVPVVHLVGNDASDARLIVARAAAALGEDLVRLRPDGLPTAAAELDNLLRLWTRETVLAPLLIHLEADDLPAPLLARIAERLRGALVLASAGPLPELGCPLVPVDLARPTTTEQREAWRSLAGADEPLAARLAAQFDLGVAAIEEVARDTGDGDLWQACLRHTRPRLDALAQRIDARRGWDELVLPADDAATLRELCDQLQQRPRVYDDWGFRQKLGRGLGITALFAGESGTGKTLAAEVIAGALGLLLYRVDLSAVVSKYIGETEKNLRRLFDAAEGGGAVLFFDEADALFGKRSEVKDSHDRYANIEVGYLLQRMEAFRGVTILATNLRQNLDAAFLRRIRFVVQFPFPGPAERVEIWRRAFPKQVNTAALDLPALSEISLTGGSIANIAVNAAFLAAAADRGLDMELVLRAVRSELRKQGRPAFEAEPKRGPR